MATRVEIEDFFPEQERAALVDELLAASGAPSTVLSADPGGVVQALVRRSKRVEVSDETRERVRGKLIALMPSLAERFGVPLAECELPQFLRYDPGDFFVPHQDGNTPLIHDHSRFRRVSGVVFLSQRSDEPADGTYGGGELVFHGRYQGSEVPTAATALPGSLVAFQSEETHEVRRVTHGTRLTIAVFFRVAE